MRIFIKSTNPIPIAGKSPVIYKCLVADDNLVEQKLIVHYLEKIANIKLMNVCSDGHEAAEIINSEHIDIVFSDINMPGLSGTDLLKSLKNPPVFVFITSHADYAAESFDLDAVDFILKPFNFHRFVKGVNKAIRHVESELARKTETQGKLPEPMDACHFGEHFFIKEAHGTTKLRYSDVFYIESMGDFSNIYTVDNEKRTTLVNLKTLGNQLPSSFCRVHRQFIVNLDHAVTITANTILLTNKKSIPVSAFYRQACLKFFINKKVTSRQKT